MSGNEAELVGRDLTPEQIETAMPFLNAGMGEYLGLVYTAVGPDRVAAHWEIRPDHYQPFGLVHGGIYCAVVEALASIAGTWWLAGAGSCVGLNNSTDFVRASRTGRLHGEARPVHRGRTQQIWEVTIVDPEDKLVARGQVRLANIRNADSIGH